MKKIVMTHRTIHANAHAPEVLYKIFVTVSHMFFAELSGSKIFHEN